MTREEHLTEPEFRETQPDNHPDQMKLETLMAHYMGEWWAAHQLGRSAEASRLSYEFRDKLEALIARRLDAALSRVESAIGEDEIDDVDYDSWSGMRKNSPQNVRDHFRAQLRATLAEIRSDML